MKQPLTEKQTTILNFIKTYIDRHGFAPTYKVLSLQFWCSIGTVQAYIKQLVLKKYIKRLKGKASGIVIL